MTGLLAKTKCLKIWTERPSGFFIFLGFQNPRSKLIELRRNLGICPLQVAQDADHVARVLLRQQQDGFGLLLRLFCRRTLKIGGWIKATGHPPQSKWQNFVDSEFVTAQKIPAEYLKITKVHQTCSMELWKWSDMQYRRPPKILGEEGKLKWITHVASVMAKGGMQSSVKAGQKGPRVTKEAAAFPHLLQSNSRNRTSTRFSTASQFLDANKLLPLFFPPKHHSPGMRFQRNVASLILAWKMLLSMTHLGCPSIFRFLYTFWLFDL